MSPHLARIDLYPIKSLDGQAVSEAAMLRGYGLVHDREYVLETEDGRVVNTKRVGPKLAQIRSHVDLAFGELQLKFEEDERQFSLRRDRAAIGGWFGERLGTTVRFRHLEHASMPDDLEAPGPTVISTATLREVGSWFGLDLIETRRRFRSTLEIDGLEAFGEDRLANPGGKPVRFRIGDVVFDGLKRCARCAVPSRDSRTGEVLEPHFAKIFSGKREENLPEGVERGEFDHFYRLAVNTRVPETEAGKVLHVGDELVVS